MIYRAIADIFSPNEGAINHAPTNLEANEGAIHRAITDLEAR